MTDSHARWAQRFVVAAVLALMAACPVPAGADGGRVVHSVEIAAPIVRSSEHALRNAIATAREANAAALIVRLDTPGGTSESTRAMVRMMLDAPMPVIVFVHPSGGRADSAGLMLTLAADVAAMAPATNIGSATPIRSGPPARNADEARTLRTLDRKFTNSTVAFARSLAEEHRRNADLAERMIRDAENASATRAHRAGLVDVIAGSEGALLAQLDGFAVKGRKARTLRTAGLTIRRTDLATSFIDEPTADEGSFLRSLLLVGGGALTLVLVAVGTSRGRRAHRRRQRRRRARERQRERERGLTE